MLKILILIKLFLDQNSTNYNNNLALCNSLINKGNTQLLIYLPNSNVLRK
jgi:hypothetical protein